MSPFLSVDVAPFRLPPDFVASYAERQPPFGFGALSQVVYYRTYSREKSDGTNECWHETIQRVVEGTYSMQKRWILGNHLPWSERKALRSAKEMYERMWQLKFLPPGRGLWAMGSPLTEERGLWAALNNCAFISTAAGMVDPIEPFCFLMDASMLGIGVGFDTKGAGQIPVIQPVGTFVYHISDDRQGWVDSLRALLRAYLQPTLTGHAHPLPVFDYSQVRPAGAPIRGFGGVAAGAGPLCTLHENVRHLLDAYVQQPLDTVGIVDIMNMIGKCVVAGNIRRSAEIAFGDPDDHQFLSLKNSEVYPERNGAEGWSWTSNNSVFCQLGMDYSKVAEHTRRNGEPGYFWLENAQQFGRMVDAPTGADWRVAGGNPCLEQSLESYELCCLVETFPNRAESREDFLRTLKFAYLYAKTVTLGRTPWPRTNEVLLRNRRIGLSMSGIVQTVDRLGLGEFRDWCNQGYATVQRYDRIYSEWLTIPRSIKTTSVKPSGTVSLLAGATAGKHWPESQYMVRRIRIGRLSSLVEPLRQAGYPIEDCFGDPSSVVVEFPIAYGSGIPARHEVSMWEKLELAALLQAYWADNQVSATVDFDPSLEGPQIGRALKYYQWRLKGVSFLPRQPLGAYPQMPEETITAAEYAARVAQLQPVDFGRQQERAEAERFCNNDTCTVG